MSLTLHTIIASTRPGRVGLQRVVDVRTGSGIFALAAARAGAVDVVALDINPMAVKRDRSIPAPMDLARRPAVCSDLMSVLAPGFLFDVIICNPPFFPGEPRDIADRAWIAGPGYRDIMSLFEQAHQRLKPRAAT